MGRDWSWWDAWKGGNADESKRALEAETDRSLAKDSGRWSWGRKVDDVIASEPTITRHREGGRGGHVDERRHRRGRGGQTERNQWSQREYDTAKRDLQRQQDNWRREQQRDRDLQERSLRDLAREARQERRRDGLPPGSRS